MNFLVVNGCIQNMVLMVDLAAALGHAMVVAALVDIQEAVVDPIVLVQEAAAPLFRARCP